MVRVITFKLRTQSSRSVLGVSLCTVLAYRMEPSGNPEDVTDLDDPTVDVSGRIAEVGAELFATVQAPTLRTRAQMRAARLERRNRDDAGEQLHDILLNPRLSGASDFEPGSDSDSASVGAPTHARHRNDQAASFDMNSFAQALSHFTSQHVPAINVTGGKAAAIVKSDKPKWDVKTEPFHTFKRRVMIWAESHCIVHLLTCPPAGDMSDF